MPAMQQPAQILEKHPSADTQARVLRHFCWIHHGLDVAPILAELDARLDLWDQHPERRTALGSIILALRIGSGGLVPRPAVVDAAVGHSRGMAWQIPAGADGEAVDVHLEHQPATA